MKGMCCWICGREADSREHMVKASDFRSIFPDVGKNKPVYVNYRKGETEKKAVYSAKSDALTFKEKICSRCNNNLTQPYDKAWEKMSAHLTKLRPSCKANSRLRLSAVFPGSVRSSMKDIQLYFCKLFGCVVADYSIPIDVSKMAACIINNEAYPNITLLFVGCSGHSRKKTALITPVTTVSDQGKIVCAYWLYNVDVFSVAVAYSEKKLPIPRLKFAWHPDQLSKKITIQALNSWDI